METNPLDLIFNATKLLRTTRDSLGRTDEARWYSIVITELEKIVSYMYVYLDMHLENDK
jgi:hypothetical protein